MSHNVESIMESVRSTSPGIVISHIRDAFMELSLIEKKATVVKYYDIIADEHQYDLESDMNAIESVSIRNEADTSELMETADRTFTGTTSWTNTDFTTYGETTDLSVTNTSSGLSCYLDVAALMVVGKKYRLHYDAAIASGTFELQSYTGSDRYGEFENGTDLVIEFTALETDKLKIVGTAASGAADFDNFSLKARGKIEYIRAKRIVGNLNEVWTDEEEGVRATSPTVIPVAGTVLSVNSATPSVLGSTEFTTANTLATSITTFTGGVEGQHIRVFVGDTLTTLTDTATLALPGGVNLTFGLGDVFEAIYRSSVWYVWIPRIE